MAKKFQKFLEFTMGLAGISTINLQHFGHNFSTRNARKSIKPFQPKWPRLPFVGFESSPNFWFLSLWQLLAQLFLLIARVRDYVIAFLLCSPGMWKRKLEAVLFLRKRENPTVSAST